MAEPSGDQGVVAALLERMSTQRIPRAQELKTRVDRGELLSDLDIDFLTDVMNDANSLRTLLDRHPEYKDLAARAMGLYHEITTRALANEKASG